MTYDNFQQVQGLAWCSNIILGVSGWTPYLQKTMEKWLPQALSSLTLDNWTICWGPAVYKDQWWNVITGPDNTWFAAKASLDWPDGPADTYVVAVAGTSSRSPNDVIWQDFEVNQVVDFPDWIKTWSSGVAPPQQAQSPNDQSGTYVAMGTALGSYYITSQAAPAGTAAAGQTLGGFLSSLPSGSKVVFAGHSLGGALAPTIALGLVQSGVLNNIPVSNVFTYGTAGASPGNGNFVAALTQVFPQVTGGNLPYQKWNTNVWNNYDIVPHAWSTDSTTRPNQSLQCIPGLYGNVTPIAFVQKMVQYSVDRANESQIAYVPLTGTQFNPAQPSVPVGLSAFWAEVLRQHVDRYVEAIGIPPPKLPKNQTDVKAGDAEDQATPLVELQQSNAHIKVYLSKFPVVGYEPLVAIPSNELPEAERVFEVLANDRIPHGAELFGR